MHSTLNLFGPKPPHFKCQDQTKTSTGDLKKKSTDINNPLGHFSTPMTFDIPVLDSATTAGLQLHAWHWKHTSALALGWFRRTVLLHFTSGFSSKNLISWASIFQTFPRKTVSICFLMFFMFFHYFIRHFSSVFQSSWLAGLQLQHLPSLESLSHVALGCGKSAAGGHYLAFLRI